jgi:hypothetical protein
MKEQPNHFCETYARYSHIVLHLNKCEKQCDDCKIDDDE